MKRIIMRRSARLADKNTPDIKSDNSETFTLPPKKKKVPAKKRDTEPPGSLEKINKIAKISTSPSVINPQEPSTSTSKPNYVFVLPLTDHPEFLMSNNRKDPVHPDVRLKKLPFYEELGELLRPTNIKASTIQYPTIENHLVFHLTPMQVDAVSNSWYCQPNSNRVNYSVQVILRFCLQETCHDQNDRIPPAVNIKVNNANLNVPQASYCNKNSPKAKEPPMKPIDITGLVKLSSTVPNWIKITWPYEYDSQRKYAVAIYLVKKLTSYELTNQLKAKGAKHPDYTRIMIKEKLVEDADCEIATTSLRVSLNCPLGKMKMNNPCRASTCKHLQCFDAALYLEMNDCKPSWICPVCSKPAPYDCLVIDGYFQQVLASDKLLPGVHEIQLLPDGSWDNLVPKKGHDKVDKKENLEVMFGDKSVVLLDDSVVEDIKKAEKCEDLSIIDLISSDDEDSEEPDTGKSKIMELVFSAKKSQEKSGNVIVIDLD